MTPAEHLSAIREALADASEAGLELQRLVALDQRLSDVVLRALVGEMVRTLSVLDRLASNMEDGLPIAREEENTPEDVLAAGAVRRLAVRSRRMPLRSRGGGGHLCRASDRDGRVPAHRQHGRVEYLGRPVDARTDRRAGCRATGGGG